MDVKKDMDEFEDFMKEQDINIFNEYHEGNSKFHFLLKIFSKTYVIKLSNLPRHNFDLFLLWKTLIKKTFSK